VDGLDNFYLFLVGITLLHGYVNTLVASTLIVLFCTNVEIFQKQNSKCYCGNFEMLNAKIDYEKN
jgi:hypothetical protein